MNLVSRKDIEGAVEPMGCLFVAAIWAVVGMFVGDLLGLPHPAMGIALVAAVYVAVALVRRRIERRELIALGRDPKTGRPLDEDA